MKNKVMLISPRTGFDAPRPQMPSTMVYLATILKKHGFEPVIIDTRVEKDYLTKIKNNIQDTLFVGLTAMTGAQIIFALKTAEVVRNLNPNVPLLWGGVHPSLFPDQTLENKFVDIVLIGEGDNAVVEIAKRLQAQKSLRGITGIMFKEGDKVYKGPDFQLLAIDEDMRPDWSLIDVSKYRIFDVQSARGCPHRCGFCYNIFFNKGKWRMRSAKSIVDEIEGLIKKYGITEVNFIDDNFFTSQSRGEELINLILKRDLHFTWRVDCRADYFDHFSEEFLRRLHKAGLREILIGCESGSQRILDLIKKDVKVEQIIHAIELCEKAGMEAQCTFMFGFPSETDEDVLLTYDLIDKLREISPHIVINFIALYTPYPGTELFEISKQYGYVPPQSLEEWGEYTYTFANVPWLTGVRKIRYESVSYLTRFLFDEAKMKKRFITPMLRIPFAFLVWDAKFRWKHRFFAFPFEWMLVKYYLVSSREKDLKGATWKLKLFSFLPGWASWKSLFKKAESDAEA